jgi:ketosteroid isomerase-like protein
MRKRGRLTTIALACALAVVPLACSAAPAVAPAQMAELQRQADLQAIWQIEVEFHRAASNKDLDLIVSLFTENATFTTGGQTYAGRDQIREFFATKAGPFKEENHWVSETPAYKLDASVNGDQGTIYFECHYVDPASRSVVSVVGAAGTVARANGRWLMTTLTASALPELTP